MALTSRFPIVNVSKVTDNMQHGFIMAEINSYKIIVIHFSPNKFWKRKEEADLLISTVHSHFDTTKWIIAGDFNALSPADSLHYADGRLVKNMRKRESKNDNVENLVNNHLDFSVIRKFLNAGLVDALKLTNGDFDHSIRTKVFLEKSQNYAEKQLDYIFLSHTIKKKVLNALLIKHDFTDFHSDHYPMLLELEN